MIRNGGIPAHGPMATRNMFLLNSVFSQFFRWTRSIPEHQWSGSETFRWFQWFQLEQLVTFVGVLGEFKYILNVALLCHLGMKVSLTVILQHFLIFGDWNSSWNFSRVLYFETLSGWRKLLYSVYSLRQQMLVCETPDNPSSFPFPFQPVQ